MINTDRNDQDSDLLTAARPLLKLLADKSNKCTVFGLEDAYADSIFFFDDVFISSIKSCSVIFDNLRSDCCHVDTFSTYKKVAEALNEYFSQICKLIPNVISYSPASERDVESSDAESVINDSPSNNGCNSVAPKHKLYFTIEWCDTKVEFPCITCVVRRTCDTTTECVFVDNPFGRLLELMKLLSRKAILAYCGITKEDKYYYLNNHSEIYGEYEITTPNGKLSFPVVDDIRSIFMNEAEYSEWLWVHANEVLAREMKKQKEDEERREEEMQLQWEYEESEKLKRGPTVEDNWVSTMKRLNAGLLKVTFAIEAGIGDLSYGTWPFYYDRIILDCLKDLSKKTSMLNPDGENNSGVIAAYTDFVKVMESISRGFASFASNHVVYSPNVVARYTGAEHSEERTGCIACQFALTLNNEQVFFPKKLISDVSSGQYPASREDDLPPRKIVINIFPDLISAFKDFSLLVLKNITPSTLKDKTGWYNEWSSLFEVANNDNKKRQAFPKRINVSEVLSNAERPLDVPVVRGVLRPIFEGQSQGSAALSGHDNPGVNNASDITSGNINRDEVQTLKASLLTPSSLVETKKSGASASSSSNIKKSKRTARGKKRASYVALYSIMRSVFLSLDGFSRGSGRKIVFPKKIPDIQVVVDRLRDLANETPPEDANYAKYNDAYVSLNSVGKMSLFIDAFKKHQERMQ